MRRAAILELMATLGMKGMRAAYDEVLAESARRKHPPERVLGELLQAEVADKRARSIKYQMTVAKLPTAKELEGFDFAQSCLDAPQVRRLADGSFLEPPRNMVAIGGTGTGKTYIAVAIARACIRRGAHRGGFGVGQCQRAFCENSGQDPFDEPRQFGLGESRSALSLYADEWRVRH